MWDERLLGPSSRYVALSDPLVLGLELVADSVTSSIRPNPEKRPPDPAFFFDCSMLEDDLAVLDDPECSDDALLVFFLLRGRDSSLMYTLLRDFKLAVSCILSCVLSRCPTVTRPARSSTSTGSDTIRAGAVRWEVRPAVSG